MVNCAAELESPKHKSDVEGELYLQFTDNYHFFPGILKDSLAGDQSGKCEALIDRIPPSMCH